MNSIFSALLFLMPLFEGPPDLFIPYQNNNQLILVFSVNNRAPEYEKALFELARDPLGLDRRDLVIFEIFNSGGIYPDGSSLSEEQVKNLRNYYHIEPSEFALVIINKQLQEIFRSSSPLPVSEIFKRID